MNTSASPDDKTYAQQTKGAAILEPLSKRLPQHPGVTHYLIHLYDYPATAEKGLEAANRYAKVAPAAPHAQCHRTSTRASAIGRNRSSLTSPPLGRLARTRNRSNNCMPRTTWSMPTFRTRRPAKSSTR